MSDKFKFVIAFAIAAGLFVAGRESVKQETKIVEHTVVDKVEVQHEKRNVVVTRVEKPDGSMVTTTEDRSIVDALSKDSEQFDHEEVRENVEPLARIEALGKFDHGKILYGGAVSKKILGPISVGIFGYQDFSFGLSVGISL